MDVSFIIIEEEEEDSLFSFLLFSSEAFETTRRVLRLLLFLSLSFKRCVFFANVFICFVCFVVVVIEEGGRPPLPVRRGPNAFSEKAKDLDANIVVVFCRRRRQSESALCLARLSSVL